MLRNRYFISALSVALLLMSHATEVMASGESERSPNKGGAGKIFRDVSYGPHERNVFDFWKADSDEPTPLVLMIHGGGWKNGDKGKVGGGISSKDLTSAGISVASINYRLIFGKHEPTKPPVKAPLHDAARALQFIRSKAEHFNIDPKKVGAAGVSAGGCSSLWLAFHDDLADPDSEDPVLRQSSRINVAVGVVAQTTLDPVQMREWMPNSKYGAHAFGFDSKDFDSFLQSRDQLLPEIQKYSPWHLASEGDPPVFFFYKEAPDMGKKVNDPTHSANFGVGLMERCKELGIESDLIHRGLENPRWADATQCLIEMLGQKK